MTIRIALAAAAFVCAGTAAALAQQARSNTVTVIGCPVPGVEPRCLVIRGADNVTYNITGAKNRPNIGQRAIRLTGRKTTKVSYCQQGIVLDNISWTYTDQKCAQ